MAFFEVLLHAALHTIIEKTFHFVKENSRRTAFLTYDTPSLLNWYSDETRALNELPYTEIASFLDEPWSEAADLQVARKTDQFRLASGPPDDLARLQTYVYDAFIKENRIDKFDSKVVRLDKYSVPKRMFDVRPCKYSDGLRSNYAMDWRGRLEIGEQPFSLRSLIAHDYGSRLPPLGEARLSNALGLAVIVWYRTEDGDILPYLPKRPEASVLDIALEKVGGSIKRLAVFGGGFHCTASGEAEWKPNATTFDQMFTADICKELYEEVGLSREDLHWIVPVALCREFLRGGKPQLFFVALARAEAHELGPKRREAIKRQIDAGRQEVLDDSLTVETPEQLYRDLARFGTIESFANMCYAQQCAESAYRAGAFDPRS